MEFLLFSASRRILFFVLVAGWGFKSSAAFDPNTIASLPIGSLSKVEAYVYPQVTRMALELNIMPAGSAVWSLLSQTNISYAPTNKADLTFRVNQELAKLTTLCTNATALYYVTVECKDPASAILANYYSEDFALSGGQVPALATNATLNMSGAVFFVIPRIAYATYTEKDALGNTNAYYDTRVNLQAAPVGIIGGTNVYFQTSFLTAGSLGTIVFGVNALGTNVVEKVFDLKTGQRIRKRPILSLAILTGSPSLTIRFDPSDPLDLSDRMFVERSSDLSNWSPVTTLSGSVSGSVQYVDTASLGGSSLYSYRVKTGISP